MARPTKKPEDRRTDSVRIPLTAAEKSVIYEAAEARGEKPITWAREVLLKASKKKPR